MSVTETTTNRNYEKAHRTNDLGADVERLRNAADQIDADMKAALDELALKAPIDHSHSIANITGLQDALNSKADANAQLTLDSLTDVDVASAANNHFIRKSAAGWISVALSATMIETGVFEQARLPSHLTEANLDAKYSGGGLVSALIYG